MVAVRHWVYDLLLDVTSPSLQVVFGAFFAEITKVLPVLLLLGPLSSLVKFRFFLVFLCQGFADPASVFCLGWR